MDNYFSTACQGMDLQDDSSSDVLFDTPPPSNQLWPENSTKTGFVFDSKMGPLCDAPLRFTGSPLAAYSTGTELRYPDTMAVRDDISWAFDPQPTGTDFPRSSEMAALNELSWLFDAGIDLPRNNEMAIPNDISWAWPEPSKNPITVGEFSRLLEQSLQARPWPEHETHQYRLQYLMALLNGLVQGLAVSVGSLSPLLSQDKAAASSLQDRLRVADTLLSALCSTGYGTLASCAVAWSPSSEAEADTKDSTPSPSETSCTYGTPASCVIAGSPSDSVSILDSSSTSGAPAISTSLPKSVDSGIESSPPFHPQPQPPQVSEATRPTTLIKRADSMLAQESEDRIGTAFPRPRKICSERALKRTLRENLPRINYCVLCKLYPDNELCKCESDRTSVAKRIRLSKD
jgi:hypothetical protein